MAKDEVEAVKWFRKAAEQNVRRGSIQSGRLLRDGQGVAKDYVEAVKWFRKAAEQNYARLNSIWASATIRAKAWRRIMWRR